MIIYKSCSECRNCTEMYEYATISEEIALLYNLIRQKISTSNGGVID